MPIAISQCRSPRRVLQVITPSRMSGAETQLVRMTARLQSRGHEVATLVKTGSPAIPEMQRLGLNTLSRRISGKFNPASLAVLASVARKHRADIVQSTLSTASWWSGWFERFGGPPSIGHVQGFTSATWHRHQSHLLAVSHAVKRHLVKQGIAPERFTVLHNAISPDDFYATRDSALIRAELGAEADTPVVGTFAHLSDKKGHRELFAAIPTVLRQLPKAQFWIVGEGDLWTELHKIAEQTGVMENIRFLGFRRDVANLMNAIDVMALPSRREPCALVYVEAALMRKPSIGCRSGGAPESIADGETGLLVRVGDSQAVAESLLVLLTNRDYAERMGQAGYDRAVGLFGWDRFIHTLERAYERVLDENPANRRTGLRAAA
ncbi:MAG TPA: glycosyltransferase family 4 protein [Lacipirellulaceae bacterium]|jgi:glycosyltransferase involved in cell wall biosynthesis|nr:glycosyltransferase family 4 protein [Lacipirellulaceae bacterium]